LWLRDAFKITLRNHNLGFVAPFKITTEEAEIGFLTIRLRLRDAFEITTSEGFVTP
jgi:hypothetical protein